MAKGSMVTGETADSRKMRRVVDGADLREPCGVDRSGGIGVTG